MHCFLLIIIDFYDFHWCSLNFSDFPLTSIGFHRFLDNFHRFSPISMDSHQLASFFMSDHRFWMLFMHFHRSSSIIHHNPSNLFDSPICQSYPALPWSPATVIMTDYALTYYPFFQRQSCTTNEVIDSLIMICCVKYLTVPVSLSL